MISKLFSNMFLYLSYPFLFVSIAILAISMLIEDGSEKTMTNLKKVNDALKGAIDNIPDEDNLKGE